jgi:hypothetical protein
MDFIVRVVNVVVGVVTTLGLILSLVALESVLFVVRVVHFLLQNVIDTFQYFKFIKGTK